MGTYTNNIEGEFWELMFQDNEYLDIDILLSQINNSDFIRPFSERLLHFVNEKTAIDDLPGAAATKLNHRMKDAGISISLNTLKNWLNGSTEPKFGDTDRLNIYKVAFALNLNVDETKRLFEHVFLDRAFNCRNPQEFIYLYCLSRGLPFSEAEDLYSRLIQSNISTCSNTEMTISTVLLGNSIRADQSEEELIQFIIDHPYNFSLSNTKAKKHLESKIRDIIGDKQHKGLAQKENESGISVDLDGETKKIFGEIIESRFRDPHSIDYMLSVIYGRNTGNAKEDIRKIKQIFQRKEITNQFPNKESFSLQNPSSYILRKELILLEFYWFFVQANGNSNADLFDEFYAEINDILQDSGYSSLYFGNPYDWLFLYCANNERPLDLFRELMNYDSADNEDWE